MIDIQRIKEDPQGIAANVSRRGEPVDFTEVLEHDQVRRDTITALEQKRAHLKSTSKEIPVKKKNGEDVEPLMQEMKALREEIGDMEQKASECEDKVRQFLLSTPNTTLEDVPEGKDENDNKELRSWGEKTQLDFEALSHDELGKNLGIMSSELGASLAKTRFTVIRGAAAKMERALINFMLEKHTQNGYEEVIPPFMVNSKSLIGTGNLPKFGEDLFKIENEDLFLIPTAEVPLTNLVADTVIKDLKRGEPLKYVAYTPCFRSEAGSYGKDTRGYLRQHQFNKVELVKICHPEDSQSEHESLTADAESILQALGLPYRVMCLCSGDIGFSSARTYDLEVWLPSQNNFREISSCSTFSDFQARRAGIRYKDPETKKNHIAHTLNGSGLAVGRTLIAIMENYQTKEGDIVVPEALRPYMGGQEIITKSS